MKSGWIVNFDDGGRIFMTEEAHDHFTKTRVDKYIKKDVSNEEHWFDMTAMKKKYPWVNIT